MITYLKKNNLDFFKFLVFEIPRCVGKRNTIVSRGPLNTFLSQAVDPNQGAARYHISMKFISTSASNMYAAKKG